jgi:GNAT superfamily N-acetyltransferase
MAITWVANPEVYFCKLVTSQENKIFAMYVGLISSYYFGKDLVANDLLLFVSQDRRGGIAAARLIKEFEDWAFANGAKEIRPASSTGVKTEETRQLYNALGYDTVGHTFVKRR